MRFQVAMLVAALVLSGAACRSGPPTSRESEVSARLRDLVGRRSGDDPVRRFYEKRGFTTAWNDAATRGSMLDAVRGAREHGLDPNAYGIEALSAATNDRAAAAAASEDVAFTEAFLRYGADLSRGRNQPPKEGAADALIAKLDAAIDGHDAAAPLASLAPQHVGYQRLREALRRYREFAAAGGWPEIGAEAAGAEFASRLAAEHDGDLAAFQRRHGLAATGRMEPETLRALAVPADARVRQIEINLERWRRMPHDFGKRYVLVNLASYLLAAYDDGSPVLDMKVIIGEQYAPTPVFYDRITYVVFNPYWNIPDTIAEREILPKGPAFLKRQGIEKDARGKLRQRPGPRNPLGQVKFMFPNQFEIYLHDTPKDSLFTRSTRDLSHGCVRVEKPVELAEFVLAPGGWTREQVEATIAAGTTKQVELSEPVPVYIFYWTAWQDADGTIEFRDDVYGYDEGLARDLGATS